MTDQERKIYSFRSAGETVQEFQERDHNPAADLPIGIKTPMRINHADGALLEMHKDLALQLRDNFKNMLNTNHGDRYMFYDFGANLFPLAFELGSDDVDAVALQNISNTTQKYMPFITLETFEPFKERAEDGSLARVGIRVTFSVPALNVDNQVVETIIFSGG